MSARLREHEIIRGRVDGSGRLVAADAPLSELHARAGGDQGGVLAIPQIAALARLSRRLGIMISRPVLAADGDRDVDLWIRAEPDAQGVDLSISSWTERPARSPSLSSFEQREVDFVRAAADWTWETDDSLRFTAVSPAVAAAADTSQAELLGKQLTRLLRFTESADGSLPILTALAEQQRFDDQIAELREGTKARYRLSGVPLIDGNGRFAGFRGSATSLPAWLPGGPEQTAPTQPEPGMVAAFGERLDKALRAPIDRIIADAEMIGNQPDGPLRRGYAGYANDIAAAGRHLLGLVEDLVDLQAVERSDFRPAAEQIDLAVLARQAVGMLSVGAEERGIRIDGPAADDTLPAVGEARRVVQILTNLISNAIRYTPENGQIWVRLDSQGNRASVTIADQGRGIAPEHHDRIFDKFERIDADEPGTTGLGLYIARRLANAMGGDLGVDSAPGQGARFRLDLPTG